MVNALNEHQFEILPNDRQGNGVVFGIGGTVSVDDGGFQPGASEWTTQDGENSTRGTTVFGRDRLTGPTWSWQAHTNGKDVSSALAALSALAGAWRPFSVMEDPQAVVALRYRIGNRIRRIYGRPRKFDAPPANGILNGYVPISMDFRCADAFTYDDEEQVLTLGLAVGSEGGFTFPAVFPVQTLPVGDQQDQVVVSGDAKTYPIVRFNGPLTDPVLATSTWTLSLDLSLTAGQWVEVDLRPWKLTALNQDGVSVAGALGKRQRLSKLFFKPGRHDVVFRASSASGAGTCQVRWSSAWNSI